MSGGESQGFAIIERIEAGEPVDRIADALGLGPSGFFAALAEAGFELGGGPGLIRGRTRAGGLAGALDDPTMARLLPGSTRAARLALAAGVLQVFDHWEASHEAAQEAEELGEKRTSAYWHGIAHRREPDPGNAAYWFRKVGRHPILPAIGVAAAAILRELPNDPDSDRLVGGGAWNPSAFVDVCSRAKPGTKAEALARRLQKVEMLALVGASVEAAGGGQ